MEHLFTNLFTDFNTCWHEVGFFGKVILTFLLCNTIWLPVKFVAGITRIANAITDLVDNLTVEKDDDNNESGSVVTSSSVA